MDSYFERKVQRAEQYRLSHGRKLGTCPACSGTGVYDNHGTPACGSCGGTGKVREERPCAALPAPQRWEVLHQQRKRRNALRRNADPETTT